MGQAATCEGAGSGGPKLRTAQCYRGPRLGWREALFGEQKREVRIETGVGTYEGIFKT